MDMIFALQALTLLLGFYMAWNIGANDVANAMGTSVGSKALSLKKAVIVAAILEFAGAFLVGSNVSETIQKGVINPTIFQADPMIFVIGMMGSLLATGILLQIASYYGLPVSTTHAIVGAVLGFGLLIGGREAVQWGEMGWIAMSWIFSPILSGVISFAIFLLIQKKILNADSPKDAARKLSPFFVFLCFSVLTLSLFYQGLAQTGLKVRFHSALSIAATAGLLAAFVSYWLGKKSPAPALILERGPQGILSKEQAKTRFDTALPKTETCHSNSNETSEPSTAGYNEVEKTFLFLQVLSACLVAFAHGANDVANAIGPVAAVFSAFHTQTISTASAVPAWLLGLGGAGIVIGLATWGWRVIETIGKKITELTPTRGFAAEFGAATTILLASKLGLPISTTHALVGAVFGVGLARGLKAVNLKTLKDIVISWIITIPLCATLSIIIFYILFYLLYQK